MQKYFIYMHIGKNGVEYKELKFYKATKGRLCTMPITKPSFRRKTA